MTHYFLTPIENAEAALRCAALVRALTNTHLSARFPNGVTAQVQGDVDLLGAGSGTLTDTFTIVPPAGVLGTGGIVHAPPQVAALQVLSTSTFVNGRRIKGRTFISPLAGADVQDDGTPSDTCQTQINLFGSNLLGGLAVGDSWVVWHRPKLGVGGIAAPITGTSCPNTFATLNSRRD